MPSKRLQPPEHLAAPTANWWVNVQTDYELEPHHIRLLTLACEAFDRTQQAREIIGRDGPVIVTDHGMKAHPAVAIERDSRLAFARLVRELDLDSEPPPDRARPPALRSNRRGA
jgi:phage terminase small subunit